MADFIRPTSLDRMEGAINRETRLKKWQRRHFPKNTKKPR